MSVFTDQQFSEKLLELESEKHTINRHSLLYQIIFTFPFKCLPIQNPLNLHTNVEKWVGTHANGIAFLSSPELRADRMLLHFCSLLSVL